MAKRRAKRAAAAPRRSRTWSWIGLGALALAAGVWIARSPAHPSPTRAAQVEYAPVTAELTFPISVLTGRPEVRAIYEFAARRPDVLHYLPCFCGCWRAGHESNYDCFVDEVQAEGYVDIDEMGFT